MLTHIFCQWNFLDPLATKAGDARTGADLRASFPTDSSSGERFYCAPTSLEESGGVTSSRERDSGNCIRVDCHRLDVSFSRRGDDVQQGAFRCTEAYANDTPVRALALDRKHQRWCRVIHS